MSAAAKLTDTMIATTERFAGIQRPYSQADVQRLRGTFKVEYTLARIGAERLWNLLHTEDYVAALGALTGNQAVQQVRAGLKAIYLSGWQVAADANTSGRCTPTRASTRSTAFPPSCAASTRRSSAPIRSSTPRARPSATGSRPSSPTPRRASAVRSTPSS